MTLPITPRVMDAICLDHAVPTGSGLHLRRNGLVDPVDDDPLLTEALDVTAPDGYAYITLGLGMTEAFAPGDTHDRQIARKLFEQFLRGHPPYALDRMVERPLGDHGLSLTEAAHRAEVAGLPVDVSGPFPDLDEAGPHRLIGFSAESRVVPVDQAVTIRVVPRTHAMFHEHRKADPFEGEDPALLGGALSRSYPSARIVFDSDGGVRLGLPATLVAHAYGPALQGGGRPLDARDLPPVVERVRRYGDLIAAMTGTPAGTHALVEVDGQVTLAVHDAHGLSFLDPGTGAATVFPAEPGSIGLAVLDGAMDLATRLTALDALRPAPVPQLAVRHTGTVTRARELSQGRTLDLIGTGAPDAFLNSIADAAATIDQSVIVIGADRPSSTPSRADLLALDLQLFQHSVNRGVPLVITRGAVDDEFRKIVDHYQVPVLHQTLGTGGLGLDIVWSGIGGATAQPPAREISPELLRAYAGRGRTSALPEPDQQLAAFLATPLEETAAILAAPGSTLRALRAQIGPLGADPTLFAAHDAFLNVLDSDPLLAKTFLDYRAGGANRPDLLFDEVPRLAAQEPAGRDAAFRNLEAITMGTLDDGASRGILEALHLQLTDPSNQDAVRQMVHSHSAYLPKDGRTDWIRRLQKLSVEMPGHLEQINQVALYVTTCP
ncbi:hypothetical protein [Catenuloplanes japonicus]|uniref:hypothetical protein n=1 Tax=Catenuloplanes japonicus TaxID=33876 RepID=UPI000A66C8EB|nr:hypothetical protein [Catenuloplanes japonicus]